MPLQYSGTTLVHRNFDNSTVVSTIEGLKDSFDLAEWIKTNLSAYNTTGGSNPLNSQTVTIDGHQYTFKTVINNANANEVLVEATLAAALQNLRDAINEEAGTKGTKYTTPTTAHATVTATATATSLTATAKTSGGNGNDLVCSESSDLNWSYASTRYGGYKFESRPTPQGLRCKVRVWYNGTYCGFTFMSPDESVTQGTELILGYSPGRNLRFLGNRYQFFTYLNGSAASGGTSVMGGVPYMFPHLAPLVISAVDAGSPAKITTVEDHGLSNGQTVFNSDIEGITGVNGEFLVTVVNAKEFTLDGSTGVGTYTATTGRVATPGRVSRMIWSMADTSNGTFPRNCFRNRADVKNYDSNSCMSLTVNGTNWTLANGPGAGRISLIIPTYGYQWFNNQFINAEPYLEAGLTSGGTSLIMGQLWDAIVVNFSYAADITVTFDGHQWSNYTGPCGDWAQNGALFLATS